MPEITVGNARIRYRVEGSGPALVLVHGTGGGSDMWLGVLDAFTAGHTVILPDLSGSDSAEDDGGELTIEGLAAQVAAVIEDAGAGPADVVGFSLGAAVTAAVAATRPDLVRRLVAVAGWSHAGDEYLRNLMTVWRDIAGVPAAFGRLGTFTAFSRDHLNRIGREAVEQNTAYMKPTPGTLRQLDLNLRLDVRPLLPQIQAPTLVVGCTQDATIPVQNAREFHTAIPGASYAELDTGHVGLFERPEEFIALVTGFLK
ncbi:alpha/beta fold hydrolase [Actinomadura macrotermitis]|uniref:Putative non-heme bromoperoxidase BpoC n=1 Tax=Actinomadura macrotermitis TaxID=2585200 RepID=A0A7K0BW21_9ACTN|nr:alpha/beta hydrolase [Actinomadura macrotermitis]MQY05357.1 putative non-heme bromoperoxidase BpoC [Actinomadura macrotermitis]